ncbi:MAG: hypothetical protein ACRBCT_01260 [Alphaproteobacteria bacterium]
MKYVLPKNIKQKTKNFCTTTKSKVKEGFAKGFAHIWRYLLWRKYYVQTWLSKYKWKIVWTVFLAFVGLNIAFLSEIDPLFSARFPDQNSIENLETVLTTLGGALIGAAFIAFTLIMFSMQVNIERMPHGLFFRFGKDSLILIMFVATLVSGIAVCFSSTLVHDPAHLAGSISLAFWGTIAIITLVIQAYERTLFLINPAKQLNTLLESVERDLKAWERRAEKAKPLLKGDDEDKEEESAFMSTHDIKKSVYMQLNPHGKQAAKNAIDHAFSFARRYAERGDYVVSAHAMQVIGMINKLYVQHKGKTFYSDHPWFENPFSSDDLVTHSLESLRRSIIVALGRKDEQQVIQILQTFSLLMNIYLQIDYSNGYAAKTHANLAAGYLSEAVISVLPHDMTDVVMEGLRLMGQCASLSCQVGKTTDAVSIIDKVGVITAAGIANKKFYPIIMTGMQQLTRLTMVLLQSRSHDLSFAFKSIKNNIMFISETFLKIPSSPIQQTHGTYLGPYYSFQESNLRPMMGKLANQILNADQDNEDAKHIIRNFVTWSDQIYISERKLFEQAVKTETDLLFHIIDWTKSIGEILVALSNAPACDKDSKKKLQRNASWLISNLSFVPDDKESVSAVATYQLHETLFEAAMTGHQRECKEYMEAAQDCLLSWAFRGGKYQLGWGILEHSLYGLTVLALLPDQTGTVEKLKYDIQRMLLKESVSQEMLDRTARSVREQAATLYSLREYPHSFIEVVMKQTDATELQGLLEEIANLLSPGTASEEINVSYF